MIARCRPTGTQAVLESLSVDGPRAALPRRSGRGQPARRRFEGIKASGNSVLHLTSTRFDEPWKQRALNAEEALKTAHHEVRTQRDHIGELLGQVRDLTTHWTEQDLLRVVDDNNRLKKQVRQLTSENNDLKYKLSAARDNARFADKRISVLEAEHATAAQ